MTWYLLSVALVWIPLLWACGRLSPFRGYWVLMVPLSAVAALLWPAWPILLGVGWLERNAPQDDRYFFD